MNIGIVDLDTSHPAAWLPVERQLGHTIVGIYDGGTVHPKPYVHEFAKQHGVARVFDTLEEMVPAVDLAIIHGCDWDTHLAKAKPFIDAGKAAFLDKPMAGNLAELKQIAQWHDQGKRIWGGSSLWYADELAAYFSQDPAKRGTPHTFMGSCSVDEFNYGIHVYSLALAALGPGVQQVQHLGAFHDHHRVSLTWADGRQAIISFGSVPKGVWIPFHGTMLSDQSVQHLSIDAGKLYQAMLVKVLPYLAGESPAPMPMSDLLAAEYAALAAKQSWQENNRVVSLGEVSQAISYDGCAFGESYRLSKYPPYPPCPPCPPSPSSPPSLR